jgi:hypothetical protein
LWFREKLMWYKSSIGEEEREASDAYIFRPAKEVTAGCPTAGLQREPCRPHD